MLIRTSVGDSPILCYELLKLHNFMVLSLVASVFFDIIGTTAGQPELSAVTLEDTPPAMAVTTTQLIGKGLWIVARVHNRDSS